MENFTESDNTAARELARMLETAPMRLKSLKLDHLTLVAKLEALMPFIETFACCTCALLERGEREDAWQGIEAYTHKFAEALNISIEDSRSFCTCLIMLTLLIKSMRPLFKSMAEKEAWEEWFQGLWEKEA
jgi:hypothetical protein